MCTQWVLIAIHKNQVFVPRQRLILAKISKKEIVFYFYNLSKECLDRIIKQSSNFGQWFTARTSLMTSIVAQKLGLFITSISSDQSQKQTTLTLEVILM